MNREELEFKAQEWSKKIEDIVVEMASVTTPDGFFVYFTHVGIVDSFNESLKQLQERHAVAVRFLRYVEGSRENCE